MTERIFSVDLALETQRPKIRLRGIVYSVANRTVRERLDLMRALYVRQVQIQRELLSGGDDTDGTEVDFDALQDVTSAAVQGMLEGISDEIAMSITEMEFNALQVQVAAATSELDFTAALETTTPVPRAEPKTETMTS